MTTTGIALALVAITVAVYWPVHQFGFVNFDDPDYVSANARVAHGLTWPGVMWALTASHAANWHPLTWLSHMLDVQLFGVTAGPQHVVSLLLHVLNTLLLFGLLRRATGAPGRSAFVAALFAVHPLHVESVAWIAERKDVLSTLFWMITMWAYVAYVQRPSWIRYVSVVIAFALGLMAKPMLVTLPAVLLLFDIWPLGRTHVSAPDARVAHRVPVSTLVLEKLPLFVLAAASSVITFMVQRSGGAVSTADQYPWASRVANALVSYVTYLGKMCWPTRLSIFYPYARSLPGWQVAGALMLLVAISMVVLRAVRHRPYLLVGWLWYVITLVPVIGLIQVGTQASADRYTYVPLIGIFIMAAWSVPDLLARLAERYTVLQDAPARWPLKSRVLIVSSLVAIVACAVTARAQVRTWQNGQTLWEHALAVNPNNYRAHDLLGVIFAEQGRTDDALVHFAEAVRLAPGDADAQHNWGLTLTRAGHAQEAVGHFVEAERLNPRDAPIHNSYGLALLAEGRVDDAIGEYEQALRLDPGFAAAHVSLGFALAANGRATEAIPHLVTAVQIDPDLMLAHLYLGWALAGTGKNEDAIQQFTEVLRLDPKNENATRALAALKKGAR